MDRLHRLRKLAQLKQTSFDVNAAIAYNTKSEQHYKQYEPEIKRVLSTSADWKSAEFAKAVYDWQQKNGLTGRWIDGKFGPVTISKMAQVDPALSKTYDVYAPYKAIHADDKPYKRVMALVPEIERIKGEMGANDIPTSLLAGWVQVESGGKLSSRGLESLDERGLFQVSRDEAAAIGYDHDRIATDQDYSIQAGISLARYHANQIDRVLAKYPSMSQMIAKGSDLYWRMVFFSFSAGQGTAETLIGRMAASDRSFSNWDDVMQFAAQNPHGYKHSTVRWSAHVQRAWDLGSKMTDKQHIAEMVHERIKKAAKIAYDLQKV